MMKIRSRIAIAALAALYLLCGQMAIAATLLPNGEQTFFDNNGLPLAGGKVYFYIPGTNSPKATYQNSGQTVSNTNPVQLDSAGRAIIYGVGTYRQVVQDLNNVQIWDQLTADTSSSVTIYAGASAGTPNSITVNAPGFSGTDGQVINFISTNTNTGGATFNPSGFGAIPVVRDSSTGPGPLTGGELVATNAVSLIYDATAGTVHILSPVTWPNTSGIPVGAVVSVAGFTAPTNYAFAYGQAVSRTSFQVLLAALTLAQSGSISSGSPTITGLASISQLNTGMPVESVGIPAGTTITGCTGTSCTMSANANTTRTGTITFFAYGDGDGSTTFNLPDYRGIHLVGRDDMGGTAAGRLTSTYYGGSPVSLGAVGGSQSKTLITSNLPPYTPAGSVGISNTMTTAATTANFATVTSGSPTITGYGAGAGSNLLTGSVSASFTGSAQGGTSTPVSSISPAAIVNLAIRLAP